MNSKKILSLILLMLANTINAKNVPYYDDIYMRQASAELVDLANEVAQQVGYSGDYELIEPNKAGLVVNPWNRMIGSAVNPQTQNNFIVINNDWFKGLSQDEQKFLIGRGLLTFAQGRLPSLVKPLPIVKLSVLQLLVIGLFCLIIMLLFWVINATTLRSKSRWAKWTIVLFVALVLDSTFIKWGHQKIIDYLLLKHECKINQMVLDKLPNKQAAINALECLDAAIKEGLKNGEPAYKLHENRFADFANELKKLI